MLLRMSGQRIDIIYLLTNVWRCHSMFNVHIVPRDIIYVSRDIHLSLDQMLPQMLSNISYF